MIIKIDESAVNQCPQIIRRRKWGSRPAKTITYQLFPVRYVIIHHTVTQNCSKLQCSQVLLAIQNYHMDNLDGDDIPYKYFITLFPHIHI